MKKYKENDGEMSIKGYEMENHYMREILQNSM